MAYYLQSTTEENLCLCILYGIWGANTNRLSHWNPGDDVIVYVDRALAALFTVTGQTYYDQTPVWSGDIYPYRIPIRLEKIVHPQNRYALSNRDTREILYKHHTKAYGVVLVLNARPIDDQPGQVLLTHIEQSPNWEGFDAQESLNNLKDQRYLEQITVAEEVVRPHSEKQDEKTISPHTEMQYYLADLGRSLHFSIWIPKSDWRHAYKGVQLGRFSEQELPALPFKDEVLRIIRNIDAIWLREGNPTHLFEVEHTTSVYSGLLRMSDLLALIPSLNIRIFICASSERKEKVKAEVNRPTFSRGPISLPQKCRFIPFEELATFMEAESKYLGHFSVSILDTLSQSLIE